MELNELMEKIKSCAQKYYQGEDTITDAEFDELISKLREMDPTNELLTKVGWGYDISQNHKVKTDHLGEAYGISSKIYVNKHERIEAFANKVKTGKIDGGSVELVYYLGKLMKAVTRGNGQRGIDVTHILRYIVPTELPFLYSGNFLGEFVLPDDNMSEDDSIAQRNIPNGFLMRDIASREECLRFCYVPYKVNRFKPIAEFNPQNRLDILDFIERCGFNTMISIRPGDKEYMTYEEMISELKEIVIHSGRVTLPLDGIVVQSNKIIVSDPDDEGYCRIDYIDEAAYKTVNDKAEVVINGVEWNLTRLGRMIPVVVFNPIQLSGADVKRATGHNAKFIIDSELGAGSKIEIIRSGEVIPYISEVLESRNLNVPTHCPHCGSELKMNGVHLVCENPDCGAKSYNSVKRWIKVLANVDDLGSSTIDALIEHYGINDIEDLYDDRYSFATLREIDGFGTFKVKTVVNMFRELLQPKLVNHYLVALNIPNISWETAYKIVENTSIEEMLKLGIINRDQLADEMYRIKGISDSVVDSLMRNMDRIKKYLEFVRFCDFKQYYEEPKKKKGSGKIYKIYATGKFEHFKTRDKLYEELSDKVEKCSKIPECDFFVTNKQPLTTNHYKQAIQSGVKVITEEELLQIVKDGE